MAFAAFKDVPQTAATTVAFPSVWFFFYCVLYIYTVNIERCVGVVQEFLLGVLGESYIAVMKWAVYAPTLLHPILYFCFCADARHGLAILFRSSAPAASPSLARISRPTQVKAMLAPFRTDFTISVYSCSCSIINNYPLFGLFLAIQYYMFSFNRVEAFLPSVNCAEAPNVQQI